jgi:hypothetical protein
MNGAYLVASASANLHANWPGWLVIAAVLVLAFWGLLKLLGLR